MNRRQFLKLGVSGIVIPTLDQTQPQFRPLLGLPDLGLPDVRTPQFGIRVASGGYEWPARKRARRSERYLLENGVPQEWVRAPAEAIYDSHAPDFGRWYDRLWDHPGQLFEWVDTAWANSGRDEDPQLVKIQIEPAPFWVEQTSQWRTIWHYPAYLWRVSIVHVSLTHDPNHARVRVFQNELGWGFGSL